MRGGKKKWRDVGHCHKIFIDETLNSELKIILSPQKQSDADLTSSVATKHKFRITTRGHKMLIGGDQHVVDQKFSFVITKYKLRAIDANL